MEPDKAIPVLDARPIKLEKKNGRYAAGGWSVIPGKAALAPEEGLPIFRTYDTAGFLPGKYRMSLEYEIDPLVIHAAHFDFDVR